MDHQIYYHIFANPIGSAIAKQQIDKINCFISNAVIHCGIVNSDPKSASELSEHLNKIPNVKIIASAPTGNEWVTLLRLHEDCSKRWGSTQSILYCHTNGAFSTTLKPEIVPLWREWMEYFAFYRYRDAISVLDEGFTAYGFDAWLTPRRPIMLWLGFRPCFRFFSGNYWWSTARAISQIGLSGIDFAQRHTAEGEFLGRIPRMRSFDALRLIGLPSISSGAYTNYNDDFRHFSKLMEKSILLDEMRSDFQQYMTSRNVERS